MFIIINIDYIVIPINLINKSKSSFKLIHGGIFAINIKGFILIKRIGHSSCILTITMIYTYFFINNQSSNFLS